MCHIIHCAFAEYQNIKKRETPGTMLLSKLILGNSEKSTLNPLNFKIPSYEKELLPKYSENVKTDTSVPLEKLRPLRSICFRVFH